MTGSQVTLENAGTTTITPNPSIRGQTNGLCDALVTDILKSRH